MARIQQLLFCFELGLIFGKIKANELRRSKNCPINVVFRLSNGNTEDNRLIIFTSIFHYIVLAKLQIRIH
jgi:hypothetical protein